ncbi:MAG: DUF3784 domain-containing protein [Oscillospiraceae bacterium]
MNLMIGILIVCMGSISVAMFMGKGAFLIAGYNRMSKEERAKYDEKKLFLVSGIGCLIITILLALLIVLEFRYLFIINIVMIVDIIAMLVAMKTFCKSKNVNTEQVHAISDEKKEKKLSKPLAIVVTVLTCVIVVVMMFFGTVNIEFSDDSFTAKATACTSLTVKYSDITDISYIEELTIGRRTNGVSSARLQAGNFKNNEYGDYKLYSYTNSHDYIVIKTADSFILINDVDSAKTRELYSKISEKTKQ